jgi:hypothetical protein
MPNHKSRSSVIIDESKDISKLVKIAADQMAVEKACRLIDSYVLEVSQEAQGSAASHRAGGA